ncbi:uncharacterized protein LOC105681473, partial [Bombus impatiens]|uniref:Uncharacterized protein LOC105681473 n=1 Tax=Bombus impatiens TaxID=132113 RepID=A0A6P3V2I4_BOMIM
ARALIHPRGAHIEQRPSTEHKDVTLPRFDPEGTGAVPSAWYSYTDVILKDFPIRYSALLSALNRALKGSAAHWLSQIVRGGKLSWPTFKEQFLSRFGGRETAASALIMISRERPSETETPGAYGSRLRSMLQMKLQDLTMPEVISALALYMLSSQDQHFQRLTLANNIKTEDQFYDEMRVLPYNDQPTSSLENTSEEPEAKRRKLSHHRVKCHYCGTHGHKITECRKRMRSEQRNDTRHQERNRPATSSKNERRVDSCVVEPPAGKLSHLGESIPFYFDSGAECSLIKESVASKFSGKRTTDVVVMRGIGNTCVNSTSQILSTVCIDGFTLEITFHALADNYLKYDIMIGREILSQGFDVNVTRNSVDICKTKMVNACSRVAKDAVNINEVDTDVVGNDKNRLTSVLQKFKESFITGFPRYRVNTGQLEIRLIDPNVTVQRSPYRLSEEERRIVRERIGELIRAKIIRPSSSPFASPILLVKKKDGSDRLCVHFRALNKNTVADRYPLPLIADQIARLKILYKEILYKSGHGQRVPPNPYPPEFD